ncbi:uncharacterized protein F4822DRAFT_439994 [Hypoxylon trugodes]|uniref:uncharacterized protein n=1 Tax=Hypoxylon trugodes TaxID=326681 RepID=UPI00219A5E99|nr:uncharacterized protein F4822DRAFT_439994 [Hypoxylon trugodes]KAI1383724.1 hypothetical protein F4822DRAFT_439994 [Hypoxylon trugodes]
MLMTPSSTMFQSKVTNCQTLVFYHKCGCKSIQVPLNACSTPFCNHETSTLLIGALPSACNRLPARKDACMAKILKEAGLAMKFQNLIILPARSREQIDALPLCIELKPQDEDDGYTYELNGPPNTPESTFQEDPANAPNVGPDTAELEKITKRLQLQHEAQCEGSCADEDHEEANTETEPNPGPGNVSDDEPDEFQDAYSVQSRIENDVEDGFKEEVDDISADLPTVININAEEVSTIDNPDYFSRGDKYGKRLDFTEDIGTVDEVGYRDIADLDGETDDDSCDIFDFLVSEDEDDEDDDYYNDPVEELIERPAVRRPEAGSFLSYLKVF